MLSSLGTLKKLSHREPLLYPDCLNVKKNNLIIFKSVKLVLLPVDEPIKHLSLICSIPSYKISSLWPVYN